MNYFDQFIVFLLDENKRLSTKTALVVLIIIAILFIDNYLGFSFHYINDKKIEQIQKVDNILKDTLIDTTSRNFALQIRSEIINRKNAIDYIHAYFRVEPNKVIKQPAIVVNPIFVKPVTSQVIAKDNFWFNISSSGFYFALAIIMIPLMLIVDKTTSILRRLATGITTTISFVLFGLFLIWTFGLIPQISNTSWIWNYLLNFFIQLSIIGVLFYVAKQKSKDR